jgi:hypothetical protein
MDELQFHQSSYSNIFINELDDVKCALHEIDPNLSLELFYDVASASLLLSEESRSRFYSSRAFGTFLQSNFEGLLREKLSSLGWTLQNGKGGAAYIVSPCKNHAIYVLTGTEDVGLIEGNPTNKNNKGSELDKAISDPLKYFQSGTVLHVLLIHYKIDHLSMELSIPNEFEKKHIQSWSQRILLPSYIPEMHINSNDVNRKNSATATNTEEIPVKRRNNAG